MSEPCPNCGVRGDLGCKHREADGNTPIAFAPDGPVRLGEGAHTGGGRFLVDKPDKRKTGISGGGRYRIDCATQK